MIISLPYIKLLLLTPAILELHSQRTNLLVTIIMNNKISNSSQKSAKNAILVINCGSSSVKFSLIEPDTGNSILSGLAECLLSSDASIKINYPSASNENDKKQLIALSPPFNHQVALSVLVDALRNFNLVDGIVAIGHRVVQGGDLYAQPTLIDEKVKYAINELAKLAPLHNPAHLIGIEACQEAFADLPHVAIFDTAFHQTMPAKAYLYGIPYSLYTEHSIRRYGFHGTSHYFVGKQAAELLNKPFSECNLISAHLGNGCSVTVIKDGKSVDTSMGMTPLEGVMMGTRSGDIDPAILVYLVEQLGYTIKQVDTLLNKKGGLLGISMLSNDCRTLLTAMSDKSHPQSEQAELALTVFCYRIAKSIASYSASLTSLDGIIFTGGIGENASWVREQITKQLGLLNIDICPEKNEAMRFGASGDIAKDGARSCFVIATNEEWVIAEQTAQLLTQDSKEK